MPRLPRLGLSPAPAGVVTADLEAALRQARCPCCRTARLSEERRIWSFLYELTSDMPSRQLFDRSLGWCAGHARLAQAVASRQDMVNGATIACLYETVVMEYLDRMESSTETRRPSRFSRTRDRSPFRPGSPCPICTGDADRQRTNAHALAAMLEDAGCRIQYVKSDGLCIPHFWNVLALAEPATANFLNNDHRARMEKLRDNLYGLQHKQNYDVAEPTTEEEDASWVEALWRFTGVAWNALLVERRR